MLLKILQLIFCVTPLVLSLILYKKPYRFMAKFHASMKQNIRARKLYTRVILFLLLLFHYVYALSLIHISMQVDMLVNSASWYQPLSVPLCSRSSWRTGV